LKTIQELRVRLGLAHWRAADQKDPPRHFRTDSRLGSSYRIRLSSLDNFFGYSGPTTVGMPRPAILPLKRNKAAPFRQASALRPFVNEVATNKPIKMAKMPFKYRKIAAPISIFFD
jgi:hypothetical protein